MAKQSFAGRLKEKILILDGAMGTMLQEYRLTAEDFGGERLEGCNEMLNLTRPDVVSEIHEAYFLAGADVVETNTFGATPVVLAEYGAEDLTEEINRAAARLAVEVRDRLSTEEWPRYVAGSMGPTTRTLSVTGGISFDELAEGYRRQALGLIEGGVDLLLLETAQDTLNLKAASVGIREAFARTGRELPIMISGTIEPMGTMLGGQNVEAFWLSIRHLNPVAVGLNCATGPEFMKDHIRTLSGLASCAVSCYPNAGLPDEHGRYQETPQGLARKLTDFADRGWLNLAGGCCGTTPKHIRAIAEALREKPPRKPAPSHLPGVSGLEAVWLEPESRPILVGERTNVVGSRKFRRLIREGNWDEAAEIARKQVKGGAQIIDVCLADPERDEREDMDRFLPVVLRKIKAPVMIDTTDPDVLEAALKHVQGKAVINSVNLEEGEEKLRAAAGLARIYGAALVAGTIDERGMAVSRERKLEVAGRIRRILVEECGIPEEDILFDPLVFPAGTGDGQYIGAALETVEGIRLIRKAFPKAATIAGISNVSFGLPPAGREVLNAVFLYECTRAGLDYAIVNTEKLQRYASIPEEERKLAEKLLFATDREVYDRLLAGFVAHFRDRQDVPRKEQARQLPLEERLARAVVEGTKEGLTDDLKLALEKYTPLEIINGPLMKGMDEVGRLFNENRLIVAEVLESAEVMKAAVRFLEPFMEKADVRAKAKVLLATVKGDVHDIGKNLVEIILSNNGYEVIDLGIKVPPETLIRAVNENRPDIIGLSGLLVKSARQMAVTAKDLKDAGIRLPLLVGGAALSRKFVETHIAPEYEGAVLYAKDAMHGLELANRLTDPNQRETFLARTGARPELREVKQATVAAKPGRGGVNRSAPVFVPPDAKPHVFRNVPVSRIWPYVNRQMLLGRHLGLKGNVEELLAANDPKAVKWLERATDLLKRAGENGWLRPAAKYRFFPARSEGDVLCVCDPGNPQRVLERFEFPRQPSPPHLCLADFVRPAESGETDWIGLMAVTAGAGVRELAERWKKEGNYLESHLLQALALELAEGLAEHVHEMMRDRWGFPDPVTMTMKERFAARYQGIRVSFGYPACPDLEDQRKLFRLLRPEEIGIRLTEECMMDPEASVTAMVFAHPDARYFSVK
ncbi:methionine synthase [Staphylospora marina]|uniref:methionine synthase n=1 Tax=Staphylospora marina TaxID=2490858 RepID=UPI000F5C1201|nr:methionine synthase [Staphylospora marina]